MTLYVSVPWVYVYRCAVFYHPKSHRQGHIIPDDISMRESNLKPELLVHHEIHEKVVIFRHCRDDVFGILSTHSSFLWQNHSHRDICLFFNLPVQSMGVQ